ncbi:hypothetical protein [Halococcus salifodinae]|uniref:Asparagine synthetase domain-containing protein n=1 Tax=Halococcus salifodinae DSM 8989 TaxID=1227456 RepID=M0N3G9_9EURY|nr:hypothetical protein [Halococcus salifodinae]EMA52068.1 hypothetical protein C450_11808 [Halococcus salifodinae DSM 8989]
MPPFNNQYLLTDSTLPDGLPDSFITYGSVAGFTIHASKNLSVVVVQSRSETVALLGEIFDPHDPSKTNEEIIRQVMKRPEHESIFEILQQYSGRYIIIAEQASQIVVVPDATCLRRVLFTENATTITSSPKLFHELLGIEQIMDPAVKSFVNSDLFLENDAAWPGTQTVDQRLSRLLPNHYLDANEGSAQRRPLYPPQPSDRQAVMEGLIDSLSGCLIAIAERYDDVRFPLTAGWDSRILLAAADAIEDQVLFYTFATKVGLNHPDVRIPFAITDQLDVDYQIIQPRELTEEFVTAMQDSYYNPRFPTKMRHVQHRYYNANRQTSAAVVGRVAEILRVFYSPPLLEASPHLLADLYGYPQSDFAHSEFAEWLKSAEPYAERCDINIFDLFYWEQRMGNWGSRHTYENDIASHQFAPFNNYNLLLSGLSIPRNERKGPDYTFFEDIVEMTRPELLSHPVNPDSKSTWRGTLKNKLRRIINDDPRLYRAKSRYKQARS